MVVGFDGGGGDGDERDGGRTYTHGHARARGDVCTRAHEDASAVRTVGDAQAEGV